VRSHVSSIPRTPTLHRACAHACASLCPLPSHALAPRPASCSGVVCSLRPPCWCSLFACERLRRGCGVVSMQTQTRLQPRQAWHSLACGCLAPPLEHPRGGACRAADPDTAPAPAPPADPAHTPHQHAPALHVRDCGRPLADITSMLLKAYVTITPQLHLPVMLLMRTSKFTIIANTPPNVMLVCVLRNLCSCCTPRSGSG